MCAFRRKYILALLSTLSAEVKAFIARVEADGGTVESPECIGTLDAEKVTYMVAGKAGKFYSQVGTDGVDDYIVARAEEGSRINKDGNIEVVPANVPVLDYSDGACPVLLCDVDSENLFPSSEPTTGGGIYEQFVVYQPHSWSNGFTTEMLFDEFDEDKQTRRDGMLSGVDYTLSFYIEMLDGTKPVVGNSDSELYDLEVQSFTYDLTDILYENVKDNIWRVSILGTTIQAFVDIQSTIDHSMKPFRMTGIQIEPQIETASSYIHTTGTAVTRSATTINQSGDADSFDSTALVMYARIKALSDDGTNRFLSIHDATFQNALMVGFGAAGTIQTSTIRAGVQEWEGQLGGYDIVNEYHRVAYLMKANRFELWIEGVKVAENLTLPAFPVGTFTTDTLSSADGGGQFFGKVAERKTKKGVDWDMKHLTETGEFKEITIESVLENASVIYDLIAPPFNTPWTNAVLEVEKVAGDRIFVFLDDDGKISSNSLTSTKDNIIDSAVTLNTWMGADDTYVRNWYGMTPNNIIDTNKIATQTVNGKQPQLAKLGVLEIKNGNVAIDFTADERYLKAPANTDLDSGNNFTVLSVANSNADAYAELCACDNNDNSSYRFYVACDRSINKNLGGIRNTEDVNYVVYNNSIQNHSDQKLITVLVDGFNINGYYNGVLEDINTWTGTYSNAIFNIGARKNGNAGFLNGTIQNITILKGDQTDNLEALHLWLNSYYNIY